MIRRRRNSPLVALIVSTLSLFLLPACGDPPPTEAETSTEGIRTKRVKVSRVGASSARGVMEYVGVLKAARKAMVSSEVGGTIERLYFDKGDRVEKGQLLAEIGASSVRIQVLQAKASLAVARSNLNKVEKGSRPEEIQIAEASKAEAQAALTEAEKSFRRVKNLAIIRAVPDADLDSAKRKLDMAKAQLKSAEQRLAMIREGPRLEDRQAARANLQQAQANVALAEDRLKKSLLRAPCDGVVSFREAEEGEVLVIPPAKVIAQIIDLDHLEVAVSVGEKDIHLLGKQERFPFTVDAIPGREFFCRLSFLSPAADRATRSFPVELSVESPDPRMADGMTARVRFPLSGRKATIKVPSAWLAEEGGLLGVFVIEGGHAQFRSVKLGAYYDQRVEIVSGLKESDEVITNPAGLRSGEAVERE
ncbi:MAG: efflux RND transporter periplasmic adaptor subunit [Deltaproteobacteria bacterium]|nr:efflux RND transporter periplasmic adaptor subunit [Deltaproteobacteria bacterium]MBW2283334.1 efflux RND transporter periplasmic adaptor subunit [Deltaproteobacteria bacterium]